MLSTKADAFQIYLYIRKNSPGTSVCLINKTLASSIISVWEKDGIPTIALNSAYTSSMQSFEEVFDLCPSKYLGNKNRNRKQCQCNLKVALLEWDIWLDQKGLRNMIIGNTKKKETKKLQTEFYRKSKEEKIEKFIYQQNIQVKTTKNHYHHLRKVLNCHKTDISVQICARQWNALVYQIGMLVN